MKKTLKVHLRNEYEYTRLYYFTTRKWFKNFKTKNFHVFNDDLYVISK